MNPPGSSSHAQATVIKLSGAVQGTLVRMGDTNVLLNCGDPSPAAPMAITSMTSLGIPQGSLISAVVLTDWKVSSCGMLAAFLQVYNTHHNRRNKDKTNKVPPPTIFLSHATRALLPHILRETKGSDANVSFLSDSAQALVTSLSFGQPCTHTDPRGARITITAHRAGHVAGGCLFTIELDGMQVTFVDGFNLHGSRVLLPASLPPRPSHIALLRGDYAVTVSETHTVIEREFCKVVHDVVKLRGKVVIPVFGVGCFVHDILAMLQDYWARMDLGHIPFYATSDALVASPIQPALVADSYTPAFAMRPRCPVAKLPSAAVLAEADTPMVIFSDGATLTTGDTASVLQTVGADANNLLVLSEYCTKGTINHAFLHGQVGSELSKAFNASIVCRVHVLPSGDEVDARDVVEMARQLAPLHHLVLLGLDDGHVACLNEAILDHGRPAAFSALGDDDLVLSYPREIAVRLRSNIAFSRGPTASLLLAEPRKKMAVFGEASVRRLKKKKHTVVFGHSWKYPKASMLQRQRPKEHKKRSSGAGFGLSILLSNNEPDDDDSEEEEAAANVGNALTGIEKALQQWMGVCKYPIERRPMYVEVGSVQVDVSPDWTINMRWSYDDEELASRIFGLAQGVVSQQYHESQGSKHN
ncbi:integrator complex subunit [Achlya hypogyna]|uniref:Integrator complex subunit n=1 Tax=Achlya hypogyna TaxID=1202772 RepID=A0A1V9Z320_ACHHY|nr:integrator complex subunit [Achlya hypogyna]